MGNFSLPTNPLSIWETSTLSISKRSAADPSCQSQLHTINSTCPRNIKLFTCIIVCCSSTCGSNIKKQGISIHICSNNKDSKLGSADVPYIQNLTSHYQSHNLILNFHSVKTSIIELLMPNPFTKQLHFHQQQQKTFWQATHTQTSRLYEHNEESNITITILAAGISKYLLHENTLLIFITSIYHLCL